MLNKDKAINFINKGIIITKDVIKKIMLLNIGFALISTIFFLMIADYINLIISISIYFLNLTGMYLVTRKKFWSYKNAFLAYALGMFNFCICINFNIYGALTSINAFSLFTFIALTILQSIIFIAFLLFHFCTFKFYKKKYTAIPFASSGIGYIAFYILKYFVDIPQEYGPLILNLVFYILICFIIYTMCNMLTKYILVKKYSINDLGGSINKENVNSHQDTTEGSSNDS